MAAAEQKMKVIRLEELKKKLGGISKATVYRMMDEGRIPYSFKIGQRAAGWLESEIDTAILKMRRAA